MKTLEQRLKELQENADEPFKRADRFAADVAAFIKGNNILDGQVRHAGTVTEITTLNRRLTVTALKDGRWLVDDLVDRLGDDEMLDIALIALRACDFAFVVENRGSRQ